MTRIVDERVTRLETGYRDGLYYNRFRYSDGYRQFDYVLPLEVPLPDGGVWYDPHHRRELDYGLIISESFNSDMRKLHLPLIKTEKHRSP